MKKEMEERRKRIVEYTTSEKKISVMQLANLLHVTPETIRSDLSFLERKGALLRVHGGAAVKEIEGEVPFEFRNLEQSDIKKRLAQEAILHIKDNSIIYMDASSSVLALGRLLRLRKNLTIFTHSFQLIASLNETQHHIFVVGGEYYEPGKRMIGPYAIEMIRNMQFDQCICGMDGTVGYDGPASKAANEHVLIQRVVQQSQNRILLADAAKFLRQANFQYAKYEDFDLIITTKMDEHIKENIKAKSIIEVKIF